MHRWIGVTCISLALAFSGCGKSENEHAQTRTQFAYRLLDAGKNAEAVLLLEEELEQNPDNDEARTLIGSALAGLAGVHIYSIFDHFQDILFRKSLKDAVLDPEPPVHSNLPSAPLAVKAIAVDVPKDSAAQRMLLKFDALMTDTQKVTIYLNRFPQIEKPNWVLIEEALTHLNRTTPTRDICVYRVFLRLIYLKSYLVQEVLRDEKFGTRAWACAISLNRFRPGADFLLAQTHAIFEDLDLAVNLGSKRLIKARNGMAFLTDLSELVRGVDVLEQSMAYGQVETLIREQFNCGL